MIFVGVGGLFAAHAGLGDPTVAAAIQWQHQERTEPYSEPPQEPPRELSEEPIEEEPTVRETLVECVIPPHMEDIRPLVESDQALLSKTHWRKAKRERKPARDLAVVEPTVRAEPLPADSCAYAAGVVDAIPLEDPAPVYPPGSLRAREEGTVTLAIVIGADGRTVSAEVHESSGFRRLDRAALEAVACWRFRPARIAGLAIQSTLLHRITFLLEAFSQTDYS